MPTAAAVGSQPKRSSAVWSVPGSTVRSPTRSGAASSSYSGTSPTSPRRGIALAGPGTVRVTRSVRDSAADDASIPSSSHTASPRLPAATIPAPDELGSFTASRTPDGPVSRPANPSHDPPAAATFAAVASSATR